MKHWKALLVTIVVLAGIAGAGLFYVQWSNTLKSEYPAQTQQKSYKAASKDDLLKLVNDERAKKGVSALSVDPILEQSAQWKAQKMADTGNYEHIDPKTGLNDGLEYLWKLKPQCSYVSENFYYGSKEYVTSKEAVKWWMNSILHREAILDVSYISTGFGITTADNGYLIAVEHFCRK